MPLTANGLFLPPHLPAAFLRRARGCKQGEGQGLKGRVLYVPQVQVCDNREYWFSVLLVLILLVLLLLPVLYDD